MSVSKQTIDTVFAQLKEQPTGATYAELAKLTGYSLFTIKSAIGALKVTGSVSLTNSRPIIAKAIEAPPQIGQTLTIRVPMPAIEIEDRKKELIAKILDSDKTNFEDELQTVLYHRVRTNTPEKNQNLMVFLLNFAEVIRDKINSGELSDDDILANFNS